MKPDWKDVHTELPIEEDAYLVVLHDRWVDVASFDENGWFRGGESWNSFVTHWAELPEAPNERTPD